jgi:hypothetical protein
MRPRVAWPDPVRMKKVSTARRVIVRSLSKPATRVEHRGVHHFSRWGTSISLAHSRLQHASASRPLSTNLENEVWSNTTTVLAARALLFEHVRQPLGRFQLCTGAGEAPAGRK